MRSMPVSVRYFSAKIFVLFNTLRQSSLTDAKGLSPSPYTAVDLYTGEEVRRGGNDWRTAEASENRGELS